MGRSVTSAHIQDFLGRLQEAVSADTVHGVYLVPSIYCVALYMYLIFMYSTLATLYIKVLKLRDHKMTTVYLLAGKVALHYYASISPQQIKK